MSNNQTETKNEQKVSFRGSDAFWMCLVIGRFVSFLIAPIDIQQANNDPEWASKSLQKRCDCEMCRSGKATTHNDNSHDQSLDQKLSVGGVDIRIVGTRL
eukprot:1391929-Amorphochlora_amoeboformis.AAC.1